MRQLEKKEKRKISIEFSRICYYFDLTLVGWCHICAVSNHSFFKRSLNLFNIHLLEVELNI